MPDLPIQAINSSTASWFSPGRIVVLILAVLLLAQGYSIWRDRPLEAALENYPPFATPEMGLRFSAKIPYDPLTFVGRGARAGLWEWKPKGLTLTEEGRKSFEESGEMIVSHAAAGRREVKSIRSIQSQDGIREIDFFYEWTEISLPASALLLPAPRPGEQYLGRAVLVSEAGAWKVQSLRTRDFEEPLSRLQDIASGVLR